MMSSVLVVVMVVAGLLARGEAVDYNDDGAFEEEEVLGWQRLSRQRHLQRKYKQAPICLLDDTAEKGDRLRTSDCKGLNGQLFVHENSTFQTKDGSSSMLCLTVSSDKDPQSGTPSLRLLPCNGSDAQEFRYNTSSLQIVHKTSGHCVDLDTSSFLVELYPCNSPVSANQQWNLTSHGKHTLYIQPASSNTTCLAPCSGISPGNVGKATKVTHTEHVVMIETNTTATLNVTVYAQDVFRITAGTVRPFDEQIGSEIVSSTSFDSAAGFKFQQNATTATLETSSFVLTVNKNPILFT